MLTTPDKAKESGIDADWISISDLMASLMMVFLCIAIFMMNSANKERESANKEREKVQEIARSYMENQLAIYDSLNAEFEQDFKSWGADLDKETLKITFQGSDAMFNTGSSNITPAYQNIFNAFLPKYMSVLAPYQDSIKGIHIEGHTSSEWSQNSSSESHFKNLALSQERASSVLKYLYFLDSIEDYRKWIIKNVAAVGYSSSHPLIDPVTGEEDIEKSKRVVFKVITLSENKIRSIIQEG